MEASCTTVLNGAKSSVPWRVGPNNADPNVVVVVGTMAACAFVHLFHVAVEHIAVSTSLSNWKTFCVLRCIKDGNPLSYGSTGPDTYGKIVGTTGMGKTVKTSTYTSKGPGTNTPVHDSHLDHNPVCEEKTAHILPDEPHYSLDTTLSYRLSIEVIKHSTNDHLTSKTKDGATTTNIGCG